MERLKKLLKVFNLSASLTRVKIEFSPLKGTFFRTLVGKFENNLFWSIDIYFPQKVLLEILNPPHGFFYD